MKVKCRKKPQLEAFIWDGTVETLEKIRAWAQENDFYESCISIADSPDGRNDLFIIAKATDEEYIHVPVGDWVVFQKWLPQPGKHYFKGAKTSIDQVWHISREDFDEYYKAKKCEV